MHIIYNEFTLFIMKSNYIIYNEKLNMGANKKP